MLCDKVAAALTEFAKCEQTHEGARIPTHCLYPSFEPVNVFVVGYGDGFKVHDGGGAVRSAWDHGRDSSSAYALLRQHASMHQLHAVGDSLVAEVEDQSWLTSAILAVANASASVAYAALDRAAAKTADNLKDKVEAILLKAAPRNSITKSFEVKGKSRKQYEFDFGVRHRDNGWILVDAISPHHASISSKYVAFSDTKEADIAIFGRMAVFQYELDQSDAALMQQVADLVPLMALQDGILRELRQ
ncbi:hypothetical protein [Roseomonas xinghualingensis]|uniref:hypothetical protein n=1 Tax=Roseomonas xinghualingensis TaxID=2986475 RepID=UPI0021F1D417|nr:hypothetical protein [Roseomonas sp. SXEYE001]